MYSIIRTKKIKDITALKRSAHHTFRTAPTPNANPALTPLNKVLGAESTTSLIEQLHRKLPTKRRKDAVLCIEYLISASPEAFQRHGGSLDELGNGYFNDALYWLRKKHGHENVLSATIHLDEKTPHLVAYVIPITKDGRLSARDFLGSPSKLREMQSDFHACCGLKRGLQRGIEGSKAKHTEVSKFYRILADNNLARQLSRKDYIFNALGHKTKNWIEAEQATAAATSSVKIAEIQSKGRSSRARALEKNESALIYKETLLLRKEKALTKTEERLKIIEQELKSRKPELDIAEAKIQGLERIIGVLEEKLGFKPLAQHAHDFKNLSEHELRVAIGGPRMPLPKI